MNVGPGLASRYPAPAPIVPAYSLIVAGPPRVGKSALLRLLLDTAPISPHATQSQLESVARFIRATAEPRFAECQVEVLWHGERILLRLLDTPGLDFTPGNEDDCDRCLRDIISVVEDRYVEGARDVSPQSCSLVVCSHCLCQECTVGESHIHLCLYVLDPANIVSPSYPYCRTSPASSSSSDYSPVRQPQSPSLPHAEISAIRRLSSRVNVLPVLGHCDTVSLDRCVPHKTHTLSSCLTYPPPQSDRNETCRSSQSRRCRSRIWHF